MLERLKNKWKVNNWQLLLVICTFAIGGSLCGFIGRKLMPVFAIEHPIAWGVIYFIVVTIIWPICVLLVSIPFGQFSFFTKYLSQLMQKLMGRKKPQ